MFRRWKFWGNRDEFSSQAAPNQESICQHDEKVPMSSLEAAIFPKIYRKYGKIGKEGPLVGLNFPRSIREMRTREITRGFLFLTFFWYMASVAAVPTNIGIGALSCPLFRKTGNRDPVIVSISKFEEQKTVLPHTLLQRFLAAAKQQEYLLRIGQVSPNIYQIVRENLCWAICQ